MFRKMRRFKQQLSEEECLQILREERDGPVENPGDLYTALQEVHGR